MSYASTVRLVKLIEHATKETDGLYQVGATQKVQGRGLPVIANLASEDPEIMTIPSAMLSINRDSRWGSPKISAGRARIARIGRARIARIGRARIARIGRARIARIGRARIARIGRARIARIGRARIARIGRARIARIGRCRIARIGLIVRSSGSVGSVRTV
ncbi:hypothetical protein F5888DRAFT_360657 [Russula emetica]|nr:hypothetical protein F5888DRAFT_360657 [Russula emetica]